MPYRMHAGIHYQRLNGTKSRAKKPTNQPADRCPSMRNGKMHAPITPRTESLDPFIFFALYAEWSLFYKAVACIPDDDVISP